MKLKQKKVEYFKYSDEIDSSGKHIKEKVGEAVLLGYGVDFEESET